MAKAESMASFLKVFRGWDDSDYRREIVGRIFIYEKKRVRVQAVIFSSLGVFVQWVDRRARQEANMEKFLSEAKRINLDEPATNPNAQPTLNSEPLFP